MKKHKNKILWAITLVVFLIFCGVSTLLKSTSLIVFIPALITWFACVVYLVAFANENDYFIKYIGGKIWRLRKTLKTK